MQNDHPVEENPETPTRMHAAEPAELESLHAMLREALRVRGRTVPRRTDTDRPNRAVLVFDSDWAEAEIVDGALFA